MRPKGEVQRDHRGKDLSGHEKKIRKERTKRDVLHTFGTKVTRANITVRTSPDGFTGFGPSPEPGTRLWVRFGPDTELWTRPRSGSPRFRSEPKFRTELQHPYIWE